jgi:hypothetical protein
MLSSSSDREENMNAEEVAKKVKDAAKIIRETSSTASVKYMRTFSPKKIDRFVFYVIIMILFASSIWTAN